MARTDPPRQGRKAEPRIIDPKTHPKSSVCLAVAAEWLGIDERSVKLRIDQGLLKAFQDGKVIRIQMTDLIAFHARRRRAS